MFIINPVFSLVAIILVAVLYFVLMRRQLTSPFGDVRSGLFTAVAEWGAKQVKMIQGTSERAWKPNILLALEDPQRLRGVFELINHLAYPMGSVKLLGVSRVGDADSLQRRLVDSQQAFVDNGIFTSATVVELNDFPAAVKVSLQALGGSFFRPNLLLLDLPKDPDTHESLTELIAEAKRQKMGVAVLVQHDDAGLGRRSRVNLWIPDMGPHWELDMEFVNLDLAILLAYRMMDSWHASLRIIGAVGNAEEKQKAEIFLARLVGLARLPAQTAAHVADGDFGRYASSAPEADLNVFPLPEKFDADFLWSMRDATGSSCLFTQDSGDESALA